MGRGWAAIGSNPLVMFGVSLVFGGLPTVLLTATTQQYQLSLMRNPSGPAILSYVGLTLALSLVTILLACIVQGALVRATLDAADARKATFGETAAFGIRVALPLIGVALIVGLSLLVGLVILVVPGVIIGVIWSVAAPALVAERLGVFTALGRSASLTKGARWRVFGLILILAVLFWMISSVLGGVMISAYGFAGYASLAQQGMPLWFLAINSVISSAWNTIWGVMLTSLYIELRDFKDGPGADKLADIFA